MKKSAKQILLLFVAIILGGISTQVVYAQTGAQIGMADQQKRQAGAAALKKLNEVGQQRCADPEYAAYYEKSPCSAAKVTPEQLEDQTKITPVQKAVLSKVRQSISASFQERQRIFKDYGGDKDIKFAEYVESMKPRIDKNDLNLYDGKITWGQYNKERNAMLLEGEEERKKIYQK